MPGAVTHDKIAMVSGVLMTPISGAAWYLAGSTIDEAVINTAVFIGSHLICSHWLSPDLDIDSAIDDRWGLLRFIWKPYERIVPHRHWLSHSGISALFRLLYLLLMLAPFVIIVLFLAGTSRAEVQAWLIPLLYHNWLYITLFALGAVVSDGIHTISDKLSTARRRRISRRRRSRRRPTYRRR